MPRGRAPNVGDAGVEPMLASIGRELPHGDGWVFEPKYDGIRVIGYATRDAASLISRNGRDKRGQFPEVADGLSALASQARRSIVVDGEVVALIRGKPARFQALQGRVNLGDGGAVARQRRSSPTALIVFDLLVDGKDILIHEPWTVRRKRLEALLGKRASDTIRLGDVSARGAPLLARAHKSGWEGIMAKRADARYRPGERTRDWLKLKVEARQEFVVGGFTDPRRARPLLGALVLGYYDGDGNLRYAGNAGGGFTHDALAAMHTRLAKLGRPSSPFTGTPTPPRGAHWVEPRVVVEIKFSEWTDDGKLRQPVFVGVRDDKDPREVTREPKSLARL